MKGTRNTNLTQSSTKTIHIVVTCTERKSKDCAPSLRLGALKGKSLEVRVAEWIGKLEGVPRAGLVPAMSLYSGDHWSVARNLAEQHGYGELKLQLWICSAGYGLLRPDTPVSPYAATFSPKHRDSVSSASGSFDSSDWWTEIAKWRPLAQEGPRTVTKLATDVAMAPNSFLLLAISKPYLSAMRNDIRDAVTTLGPSARIAVISAGSGTLAVAGHLLRSDEKKALETCLMPTSARLKELVGGAMQSLNIRLARHAVADIANWFPSSAKLAKRFSMWLKASPALKVYARERLSDLEVARYIQYAVRSDSSLTASRCLRHLRDDGHACEQHRFGALFAATALPVTRLPHVRRATKRRKAAT